MITDYIIISMNGIGDFEHRINELIKKGWKPQGGVCENYYPSSGTVFTQAMILENDAFDYYKTY